MLYTSRAFNWTVIPLSLNVLVAAASFYNVDEFGYHPELCYLTVFLAISPSITTLIAFGCTGDLRPFETLMTVAAHCLLLILIFAGIYRGYGLLHGGQMPEKPIGAWTAIYFSIVTWTTVGYGDYAPPAAIQMIAAIQALVGYIFFGTIVGITTAILGRDHGGSTEPIPELQDHGGDGQ